MKKSIILVCLFLFAAAKYTVAQKSLVKQLEVKENRFFYKPISNRYIRTSEIDFDNSAYMDIKPEGEDIITLDVFALDEDKGGWVKSESVHGTNFASNHKYVKLQNEVYIVEDAVGEGFINLNVRNKPSFILYTKEK
ncbi:MAG: hypothetical protein JST02_02195, partial [Bacteroidetes bacterium]|nr:hypothetical protein [Bacteroidota bacterium]